VCVCVCVCVCVGLKKNISLGFGTKLTRMSKTIASTLATYYNKNAFILFEQGAMLALMLKHQAHNQRFQHPPRPALRTTASVTLYSCCFLGTIQSNIFTVRIKPTKMKHPSFEQ